MNGTESRWSDARVLGIATLVATIATTSITGLVAYSVAGLNIASAERAKVAAVAVEEVKTTLLASTTAANVKMDNLAAVAKDTHTLVNSNMGVQLRLTATALRRIADITKDPADVKASKLADTLLAEHIAKQAIVDANNEPKRE